MTFVSWLDPSLGTGHLHRTELRRSRCEGGHPHPTFQRGPESLVGPDQPLRKPPQSDQFDYEAEFAVVIGRKASRVRAQEALDYVLGFSCLNDGSLQDYQRKTARWGMGKNFDRSGSLGPAIVTSDELPGGIASLAVVASDNGTVLQRGSTADTIFPVPRLIEELSSVMTLNLGDVIATVLPAGIEFARKPPVWLRPGDV